MTTMVRGLEEACAVILRAIHRERVRASAAMIVGISGPVCSGKSTLARMLSGCVVCTDDYLPDYATVPMNERDLPEKADLERLRSDLMSLRSSGSATSPIWSFTTHRREGERVVSADGGVAICEGIHALHERLVDLLDVAVFVEAARDVRRKRCEARELAGERGWTVEHAREHFDHVAEPTFDRYASEYRAKAHVIVLNDHGSEHGKHEPGGMNSR